MKVEFFLSDFCNINEEMEENEGKYFLYKYLITIRSYSLSLSVLLLASNITERYFYFSSQHVKLKIISVQTGKKSFFESLAFM
jgi:hypothetical protein